jgi:hypothetical protein
MRQQMSGEHLAEHFVGHRRVSSAPHVVAELRLDHCHGGFDVRPLVVVLEKRLGYDWASASNPWEWTYGGKRLDEIRAEIEERAD